MENYRFYDRIVMGLLSPISAALASKYIYWRAFGKKLNLKTPATFDEKLMWLKLYKYTNNPLITQCIDKYQVREYVREHGCEDLLIPLHGCWNKITDLRFDRLPASFVLKCNHGCGYNIICPDKSQLDFKATKKKLQKWMKEDFWLRFAESNYKDVEKKIICEAYIGTPSQPVPVDYKFYCFHGKAHYVMVCCERKKVKPKFYFFDRNWSLQRINPDGLAAPKDFSLPEPQHLKEMFTYADKLSGSFPFVRVDLYDSEIGIKFGELTFTPSAALDTSRLPQADALFCDLLKLPRKED